MRLPVFLFAMAFGLTALAATASAEDRLGIRPGMTLEQVSGVLKPRCEPFVVEGDAEKSVTCRAGATEIEASLSTAGRVYYVVWREPATDADVKAYTKRIAAELGFAGKGKDCKLYDYPMHCWTAKDGTVLYSGERDGQQRFVSYLMNEAVESQDMGSPTSAPVLNENDDGAGADEIILPSQ